MTSKGQFTLPARVRQAMALNKQGDKLVLEFSPATHQAILSKPVSFADIQARAKQYMKLGIPPLSDVGDFYETRAPRI